MTEGQMPTKVSNETKGDTHIKDGRRHEIELIHNHGFIITTSAQAGEARPKTCMNT